MDCHARGAFRLIVGVGGTCAAWGIHNMPHACTCLHVPRRQDLETVQPQNSTLKRRAACLFIRPPSGELGSRRLVVRATNFSKRPAPRTQEPTPDARSTPHSYWCSLREPFEVSLSQALRSDQFFRVEYDQSLDSVQEVIIKMLRVQELKVQCLARINLCCLRGQKNPPPKHAGVCGASAPCHRPRRIELEAVQCIRVNAPKTLFQIVPMT